MAIAIRCDVGAQLGNTHFEETEMPPAQMPPCRLQPVAAFPRERAG